MLKSLLFSIIAVLSIFKVAAQGPELSFFYNQSTNLPWAEAFISFKSGAKSYIKFLPANDKNRSAVGTANYDSDIDINIPLVFIQSTNNADSAVSIKSRAVLYCYDCDKNDQDLISRLKKIESYGVGAIILFSMNEDYPFVRIRDNSVNITIPVITVTKTTANLMLAASGYEGEKVLAELKKGSKLPVYQPIVNFSLKLKGNFSKLSSKYADIRFNCNLIDSMSIKKLLQLNDSAMGFIVNHFSSIKPLQTKSHTTYFSDYDEKLFYTAHWGKGLANEYGVFSVIGGSNTDYTLAVHELTHIFFKNNLNGTISFISEGVAMYAEAKSVGSNKNNIKTQEYLDKGILLPITELIKLEIGSDKKYTDMGYYASGSFVQFLIEAKGQNKFIELWQTNQEWEKVYGLNLLQLEKEWHNWLQVSQESKNV